MIEYEKSGDFLFPSSNFEGFADLDINKQGDFFDYPMVWGSQARVKSFNGRTIIFYTDDYRFNALGHAVEYGHVFWKLWERPEKVYSSGAPSFVEVNFSTSQAQPFWVAASCIGKKRQLSRLFQEHGMRCWVDLNVAPRWEELNLVGVPKGWMAYATHFQRYMDLDMLKHQHALACEHAMSDNIRFAVYAHNKEVETLCMREGWLYIPEDWQKRDKAKAVKKTQLKVEAMGRKEQPLEVFL